MTAEMINARFGLNEPFIQKVLQSEEPESFLLEDIMNEPLSPPFLKVNLIRKAEKDFESGLRSGVNRTPTFFINGKKYEGEWKDNQLLDYLKTFLQSQIR